MLFVLRLLMSCVLWLQSLGASNAFYLLISDARDNFGDNEDPDFGGRQHWNTFRSDNRFYDTVFVSPTKMKKKGRKEGKKNVKRIPDVVVRS